MTMELMIRDGDYVPGGGSFRTAEGAEELLERVLFKLQARRGSFPLLPELGSQLYRLPSVKKSQREIMARQYVAQALADEEELEITGVTLSEENGQGWLSVSLLWRGEPLSVETGI